MELEHNRALIFAMIQEGGEGAGKAYHSGDNRAGREAAGLVFWNMKTVCRL